MKLEKIRQNKDKYLTKYVFKQIELIKEELKIPSNARIYYLGYSHYFNYFLYKNKVIISVFDCDRNIYDCVLETLKLTDLYVITLLNEYPKTCSDIIFETVKQGEKAYTSEDFLNWIDMPSMINVEIDLPYYKIIKFLQQYKKTAFRTKDYLFYSKKDDEYCFTLNIYAKDLKNNAELKLFIPANYIWMLDMAWINAIPSNLRDITAAALSGKLSKNKIRQCKRAFLEFANECCEELETKNFYALELVKQTIQPVEYDYGWFVHRIFSGKDKFSNIWVYDLAFKNEEPYFIITDNPLSMRTSKAAVIDIKSPKYHKKGIYKQGLIKFKSWELDEKYIKELIEFFKSPINEADKEYYNYNAKKYVKTNWQKLIYEYNHNTAGYDIDENGCTTPLFDKPDIEALPLDLSIPDYTKLLQDKEFINGT